MSGRTIAINISPNATGADVRAALLEMIRPWSWRANEPVRNLEARFERRFGGQAFSYESARSALYAALAALRFKPGDEALLQAFTCVAVPNAVLWAGGTPVYVDMNPQTYNIDLEDLERKITPRSRAVIVQHTFGIPAKVEEVRDLARRHGLFLIEDCAHALGGAHRGRDLGGFGDAAVFSFGRDKVISSVFGGMLVCRDDAVASHVALQHATLRGPSRRWVMQQLLHPVATNLLVLPLYFRAGLGKGALVGLQRARLLSRAVLPGEKAGQRPKDWVRPLPGALARLAMNQLDRLSAMNAHRRSIASVYREELAEFALPEVEPADEPVYLRFPILTPNRDRVIADAYKRRVLLDKWYETPVAPTDVDLMAVGYERGSCPNVESACARVLNLPTHPRVTEDDARQIARLVNQYGAGTA